MDKLEQEAADYLNAIEALGGMINAIEQGYVQRQIEQSAYAASQALANGERIIVGLNRYRNEEAPADNIFLSPRISNSSRLTISGRSKTSTIPSE